MNKFNGVVMGIAVSTLVMAGGMASSAVAQEKAKPAAAQDKAKAPAKGEATRKVVLENDKVQVFETRFPVGSEAPSTARADRVIYNVKGGTIMRIYPDGKTLKVELKTGETRWVEAGTYGVKNIGKGEIVQIAVVPKK
jgi:hypothetical protein